MNKNKLIIISGPSGVGKSTIRDKIVKSNDKYWYSISMTTRPPRENEKNGIDYYFVTKEEFSKNIKNNNFIEYVEVYKDIFYGTPKNIIKEKLKENYTVILEIDVEGALKIKKEFPNAVLIFIAPPSTEELKKRLTNRKTNSKKDIEERLNRSLKELEYQKYYDHIIINNNIDDAVQDIINIIEK